MAFTLEAIQEAHKKYTGVDFPKLIREFKLMGMATNICNLKNGLVTYIGKNFLPKRYLSCFRWNSWLKLAKKNSNITRKLQFNIFLDGTRLPVLPYNHCA